MAAQQLKTAMPETWLAHLEQLHVILRANDVKVSPDRWLNATDLLTQLIAENRLPNNEQDICSLLSPLFCQSEYQQERFPQLIAQWWQSAQPLRAQGATQKITGKQSAQATPIVTEKALKNSTGARFYLAVAGLMLIACVVLFALFYQRESIGPNVGTITTTVVVPSVQNQNTSDLNRSAFDIPINPIPSRNPPEAKADIPPMPLPITANEQRLLDASPWIVMAILPLLSLILLAQRNWQRIQLKRKKLDSETPLIDLKMGGEKDSFFDGPNVRNALRQLHRPINVASHRLDIDKTLTATLEQAGLFTPITEKRQWVPNVLVWVNVKGSSDPLLGMAQTLAERLKANHTDTELYRFQGQPDYLRQEPITAQQKRQTGQWIAKGQLLAQNPSSRIIILGRGDGLIDLWSEQPLPWLADLNSVTDLLLLEADGATSRSSRALSDAGILLASLTSAGLEQATQWATKYWAAQSEQNQGRSFAGKKGRNNTFAAKTFALPNTLKDSAYLTQPVAPPAAELKSLMSDLTNFLHADGLKLLTATAIYPEFRWSLVRLLDLSLAKTDSHYSAEAKDQERRLLNLAQLPWAREGWLPKWLRDELITRASSQNRRALRALYFQLLEQGATGATNNAQLQVFYRGKPSASLASAVRHWFAEAKQGSALSDGVFADFLWGGWYSRIRFVLPRYLTGLIPHPRFFYRMPGQVLAVCLALAVGYGMSQGWQQWGAAWLQQQFTGIPKGQLPAFKNMSETKSDFGARLEQAVEGRLLPNNNQGSGFWDAFMGLEANLEGEIPALSANEIQAITENGLLGNTDQQSVVLYQPEWQAAALWLAERIEYSRYGQTPKLVRAEDLLASALGETPLLVWQPEMGVQGNGFRDELTNSFKPEQWLAEVDSVMAEQHALIIPGVEEPTSDETFQEGEPELASEGASGEAQSTESEQLENSSPDIITFTETLKLPDASQGPTMVVIPSGTFTMGSPDNEAGRSDDEGPQRQVSIARFAISEAEITFDEYDRFASDTNRELPDDRDWGRGLLPVINVSWNDATAYAQWLSDKTGQNYRLPTESEWEYATRANTITAFNTGECLTAEKENINSTYGYANCPAGETYLRKTTEVKSYSANNFGLYDTHGNVSEWVQDCWHENYQGAPIDGRAWLADNDGECARRVLRGGSSFSYPRGARSAYRHRNTTDVAIYILGFRLARTLGDNEFIEASE